MRMLKFRSFANSILGLALTLIPSVPWAHAQGEVKLSQPIGGDILPGGSFVQTDIKSSFVFSRLIPFAIRYLVGLAAALAVIAIMVGGYQYLTAYGDTEKHKNATKTIAWAVLGLILAITSYAIVSLITSIRFGA
ncbi:hypothetical protein HZA44_00545 [Candidatus Peregrinibacteria bacterium]|nr:hypothetical protein [Candidatus Peregrinibacteria bacterium]